MQPQLTLKDGSALPLTDEIYELVLGLVRAQEAKEAVNISLEALEAEFAELFTADAPTTSDLLEEHRLEQEREERKLQRLS